FVIDHHRWQLWTSVHPAWYIICIISKKKFACNLLAFAELPGRQPAPQQSVFQVRQNVFSHTVVIVQKIKLCNIVFTINCFFKICKDDILLKLEPWLLRSFRFFCDGLFRFSFWLLP